MCGKAKESQKDFGLMIEPGPSGWDMEKEYRNDLQKIIDKPNGDITPKHFAREMIKLHYPDKLPELSKEVIESLSGPTSGSATSGGLKADDGKPRMDLLDSLWLSGVANVLGFGAKKYAANNWRKGIAFSRLIGGVLRHIFAWLRGEDNDPESGLPHLHHASCGLMFLSNLAETRKDLDDRHKVDNKG